MYVYAFMHACIACIYRAGFKIIKNKRFFNLYFTIKMNLVVQSTNQKIIISITAVFNSPVTFFARNIATLVSYIARLYCYQYCNIVQQYCYKSAKVLCKFAQQYRNPNRKLNFQTKITICPSISDFPHFIGKNIIKFIIY